MLRKYTLYRNGQRETFRASSHTAAHRHLCGLLRVDGLRSISAWHHATEVHASLYDGRDFIRYADGRVRKDWPASTGIVREV